ncbi:hypothetical protein [Bradyrhizobium septentrionale]|uniref:PepSY domain-containing protein n=1 Tax=Bradyrhizobium septentrionale TaxID=1404411 RepID=A0A973VYR4_9BRAD|nr:hypothetical protein [Bradyrhizobium septentrionale]UGY12923.1 hypothetical protein HAP48_0030535 [Bradyrhizobium septentrionale]UGY21466.1 hypothetical protein HU675_0025895 [Bradyrhizobium septentrionale]
MTKFTGLAFAALFVGGLAGSTAQAEETLQDLLAVQLRSQGYACDKPLKAERDDKLSKPDNEAWTLTCSNATYRVTRVPDLAAKVEVLK